MESRSLPTSRDTLYPVQYLRAAAALAVFWYHYRVVQLSNTSRNEVPLEQIGAFGVDLFFVISGFIMARIVWNAPVNVRNFMGRRVGRVVPLYWSATLVVFAIAYFMPSALGSTKFDPLQLAHSLLFLPYGLHPDSTAPVLIVGWTLNYEMFFYAVVALFAGLCSDRSLVKACMFLSLLVAVGALSEPQNAYALFYTDPIILEFVIGISIFHIHRMLSGRLNTFNPWIWSALACLLLFMLAGGSGSDSRVLSWGVPAGGLLLCSLHLLRFKSEALKRLGDWSYSIYLLHLFAIFAFAKTVGYDAEAPPLEWLSHFAVISAILIGCSAMVHNWFDLPMTRWLTHQLTTNPTLQVFGQRFSRR